MECLVDGEMLVLQGEDLIAMDVREGYINRDQQPYISSPSPPPLSITKIQSSTPKDQRPYNLLTLLVAQRQHLPFAFTDLVAIDRLDCEIVAGEGECFLFHVECHWLGTAL